MSHIYQRSVTRRSVDSDSDDDGDDKSKDVIQKVPKVYWMPIEYKNTTSLQCVCVCVRACTCVRACACVRVCVCVCSAP